MWIGPAGRGGRDTILMPRLEAALIAKLDVECLLGSFDQRRAAFFGYSLRKLNTPQSTFAGHELKQTRPRAEVGNQESKCIGAPYLPDHEFYAPPAVSGSGFEDLLASFGSRLFFKPSPLTPDAAFNWRSDIVAGSGVSVWRIQQSADWSYSCEPVEQDLTIAFLNSGFADMVIEARHVERTPSIACVYAHSALRHCKLRTNADESFSSVVLRFDAGLVAKVQTAMFGRPGVTSLDLTPTVDLSTGTGRTLHQLASTIVSGMHAQVLSRSPNAMALLTEAALQLVFENVPHRLINLLDRRPPDLAPKHVRQAMDFMRANLHLPLTMIDIADAAGVSSRTLQLGFRKFRDTTPATYLRQIRLDAVRAELSNPENRLPVTEVALKWGFTHMGRLAALYRATFGDYPSETVKNASANY